MMKTSIKMESAVDVDLDDTNAGHADALDGAFVMGVAERLGIAWVLRSKVGNQNLPVYTFTGPRAALREFCRIIVPNGSFDPLGDTERSVTMDKPKPSTLSPELLAALQAAVDADHVFPTLGRTPVANVVTEVSERGFLVQTAKAQAQDGGTPQHVPAWMLQVAWDHKHLLNVLRVMRSSAVCAVLARLPGVQVDPGPGITLRYQGSKAP